MSRIPDYPTRVQPLDGSESVAAWQNGRQIALPVLDIAGVAIEQLRAEIDPEASAYATWLTLPGNAGKSRAAYIADLKGDKGDRGEIGSSDNTYTPDNGGLAAFKASDTLRAVATLARLPGVANGRFAWTLGDYSGTPADQLDQNIVQSNSASLAAGAWVRQGDDGVTFRQAGAGAVARPAREKARESVSVLDFGAKGDGVTNDTEAFNAAARTGKRVFAPYPPVAYLVKGIDVVDNMHVEGERRGLGGSLLLVAETGGAAFYNRGNDVFDCTFENLSCGVAPGVTNAAFYGQANPAYYSAYFTFRRIETHRSLRAGYRGLFIFGLWDRCRDGYLGFASDTEHSGIVALAGSYGQGNRQNINRVKDSMFFGAFGGQAAITASYGTQWELKNVDFEALKSRAFIGYNVTQAKFSGCWFENISAASLVALLNYPGVSAKSSGSLEHCTVVMTGNATYVVTLDTPSNVSFRRSVFALVPANSRIVDQGALVTINEDNEVDGDGAATFMAGAHHDVYSDGRRLLGGAAHNNVPAMTLQNAGGVAADSFLSGANIVVGGEFKTIARSATGLGGTCVVSGFDPAGGAQFRLMKDWQGATIRDAIAPLNATGKAMTFQSVGNELQMKVDAGSVTVFTTILN